MRRHATWNGANKPSNRKHVLDSANRDGDNWEALWVDGAVRDAHADSGWVTR